MLLSVERSDEDTSLSFEVIRAVAEREGVDPIDIEPPEYEPLYDVLNPEALDALFAPRESGEPRGAGRIEFTYCGYDIVVDSDGTVELQD